jgi:hypothetical protein
VQQLRRVWSAVRGMGGCAQQVQLWLQAPVASVSRPCSSWTYLVLLLAANCISAEWRRSCCWPCAEDRHVLMLVPL